MVAISRVTQGKGERERGNGRGWQNGDGMKGGKGRIGCRLEGGNGRIGCGWEGGNGKRNGKREWVNRM